MDDIGSPGSWWLVKSAYKFRSDGDCVRFGDSVELHELVLSSSSDSRPKALHISDTAEEFSSGAHQYVELTFGVNLAGSASRLLVEPYRANSDQEMWQESREELRKSPVYGGSIVYCAHKEIDSLLSGLETPGKREATQATALGLQPALGSGLGLGGSPEAREPYPRQPCVRGVP
eukprot:TRINITY_DN3455_c0_g3_i1.p2 TRINITY_DN3455_c0_g3~~TRINITY_DN3455_c0_g3_i1.p2  ORF type:complete len:175 (-),score=23.36 TRINITY_DN3455_c0_g3_i1:191-715(-)